VITTFSDTPIEELPPPNHFKPIRGFSRVWTHEETVRQQLGWSYGLEQAYIVRVQTAEGMIFFDLPNGQVIQFEENGNWHVIR
jgi:hypothetical protein